MKRALLILLALASAAAALAAESPQQAFVKAWEGRTVTVRSTLYSLLYNERGKLGTSRRGLREGLVVASPAKGAYFQFDGRQGRHAVIQYDLNKVLAAVNWAYQPDVLDVRQYRKLEAVAISRYDPGAELLVTEVRVAADQVQFELATAESGEPVTGIRVRWPVPLSNEFSERALVEDLVQRFVEIRRP